MGNVHFRIAARNGCLYRFDNLVEVEFDVRPLLVAEDKNGNLARREILLVADVFVRSKKQVLACLFSFTDQVAVLEFVPSFLSCKCNFVSSKASGKGLWRAVIEKHSHAYSGALSKL